MREDETLEGRIGRKVAEAYRPAASPSPDARARLLERIAAQPAPRAETDVWARLVRGPAPSLRVAMAAALVLVAGVALIGRSIVQDMMDPGGMRGNAAATDSPLVRFELAAPEAGRVTLVGDFNGWDRQATPMRRSKTPGSWTVSVPLERGRHAYGFMVDGVHWVPDPLAPLAPADGFGGVNSVIVVDGRGTS
jgi:hypothetical protein